MVELGDMTPEDAQDTAEPDAFAVAYRYFADLLDITNDDERKLFTELPELEQWVILVAFTRMLARIRRERVGG